MAPTTGWPLTNGPGEVRRVPVLHDKRPPSQQPLCLFMRRLPMTPNCSTRLGHSLGQLHAVKDSVVHLKWVRDHPRAMPGSSTKVWIPCSEGGGDS